MYTIAIPYHRWFEYQLWLNQNFMYPLVDYRLYPTGIKEMNLTFVKEENYKWFQHRWGHTLESR